MVCVLDDMRVHLEYLRILILQKMKNADMYPMKYASVMLIVTNNVIIYVVFGQNSAVDWLSTINNFEVTIDRGYSDLMGSYWRQRLKKLWKDNFIF